MMFATQKEGPELIHCNLHFMSHRFLLHPMLQSGDISCFSSRVELILGICHILNLMTTIVHHCSKGMHFTAEYAFFSGSGLLLSNILLDYDHFPQDTRTWGKPTFQRWQQAPPFLLGSVSFQRWQQAPPFLLGSVC